MIIEVLANKTLLSYNIIVHNSEKTNSKHLLKLNIYQTFVVLNRVALILLYTGYLTCALYTGWGGSKNSSSPI